MCDIQAMFLNCINCTFSLGAYRPVEDSFQLYPLGWYDITQCVTSESVQKRSERHNVYTVKFEGAYLPAASNIQYEVCYIHQKTILLKSSSFTFGDERL